MKNKDYSTEYLDIIAITNDLYNDDNLRDALYKVNDNYSNETFRDIENLIKETTVVKQENHIMSNDNNKVMIFDTPHYSIPYDVLTKIEIDVIKHKHFYTETVMRKGKYSNKEKSWVRIAEELNKPVTTIKSVYSRAIKKLHKACGEIEYLPKGCILPGQKRNGLLISGGSLVNTVWREKPCTVLTDLQRCFGDNQSVCPGYYNEWKELTCLKRRKLPSCSSCKNVGSKFYDCTKITTNQCVESSGISRSTISKYLKNNAIIGKMEKGKYYFNCKQIADCEQEVFNKRLSKYQTNKKLVSAYYKKEKLLNEYDEIIKLWAREKIPTDIAEELSCHLKLRIEFAKKDYELLLSQHIEHKVSSIC